MNTPATTPLPGDTPAQALSHFPEWCVAREFGVTWTEAEQSTWQRVADLLLSAATAHTALADLAALLRDPVLVGDEVQELDRAVRWWDAARRAGQPVDADFGECWRACEWLGLLHDLTAMGLACRAKHRDGQAQANADLPRLLAHASRVALRYGPLKPLLRLLEPLSGASVQAGFTF
jgi:aminoglycoside/choline kinase family phosphotransferase